MCGEDSCCCGPRQHHGPHMGMGYHLPLMDVQEEIKMLEEYKEALTKRLEQVNKRIEGLKH